MYWFNNIFLIIDAEVLNTHIIFLVSKNVNIAHRCAVVSNERRMNVKLSKCCGHIDHTNSIFILNKQL